MNTTYIKVLKVIESFASEHLQVKKFGSDFPEQLPNFGTETEEYPLLFVSPNSSIFDTNINQFTLTIYCFDVIQKDRENINTILSDTHSILNDLKIWLREGEIPGIDVDGNPNVIPVNNALLDYVAGWEMSITLDVDTYGICQIPFDEAPAILDVVNNIVYSKYLTCETLANCSTFTDLEDIVDGLVTNSILEAPMDGSQYARQSGTWSVVDIDAAASVWKTGDLTTNATTSTQNVYRQGSLNLVGSNKFFSTGPTTADIDGEILGTNFGHITSGGGTIPFIQLLSNHGNGSAGTNHFIGRYVGAGVGNPQMNFSAIKSTSYDAWGDTGRVLFRFNDGYLTPQSKLDIGTDYLKFTSYPSSRNDSGSINNFLYTDTVGVLKSKPINSILESRNGINIYFSDFVEQGDFRVNNAGYNAAQAYYGGTGNVNHPGQIIHYLDNITSIALTFINFGYKEPNQVLDFIYMVDTTQSYLNSTIGCGIDTGVVANDNAYYFHIIGSTVSAVTSNGGTKTTVSLGSLASGDINSGTYYHYRISVLTTNSIKFDVYQMNGTLLYTTTITTNIVGDYTNNMPIGIKTYITNGTPSITPVYMARYDYISIKYNTIKQRGAI